MAPLTLPSRSLRFWHCEVLAWVKSDRRSLYAEHKHLPVVVVVVLMVVVVVVKYCLCLLSQSEEM
jgi:hypothetical protein